MIPRATRAIAVAAAFGAALAIGAPGPAFSQQAPSAATRPRLAEITITVGDTVAVAEIDDNPTARDFLQRLPMTVRMARQGEREYHSRMDRPLSVAGPKQGHFDNGDLGYWAPGGYLAVFLDKTVRPTITDLIVIGRITSDLTAVKKLGAAVDMVIEHRIP